MKSENVGIFLASDRSQISSKVTLYDAINMVSYWITSEPPTFICFIGILCDNKTQNEGKTVKRKKDHHNSGTD